MHRWLKRNPEVPGFGPRTAPTTPGRVERRTTNANAATRRRQARIAIGGFGIGLIGIGGIARGRWRRFRWRRWQWRRWQWRPALWRLNPRHRPLEEFGSKATHAVPPRALTQRSRRPAASRPGPAHQNSPPTVAVRRLAFDRTLPPSEALGRIRDAFHDYDQQGVCSDGPLSRRHRPQARSCLGPFHALCEALSTPRGGQWPSCPSRSPDSTRSRPGPGPIFRHRDICSWVGSLSCTSCSGSHGSSRTQLSAVWSRSVGAPSPPGIVRRSAGVATAGEGGTGELARRLTALSRAMAQIHHSSAAR